MNYLEFFGLQSEPFLNSPSSRVFYKSAAHGKALLRLMTAADSEGGILLLLGEPGVGKSLLLRRVLETVSDEAARSAYVPVPAGGLSEGDLARVLSVQLRGKPCSSLAQLGEIVNGLRSESMNVLVLIDDAERLDQALLDGIAALGEASIILVGAAGAGYPAAEKFELSPLNAEATEAYIRLRLKTSGRVQEIFTAAARAKVFALTNGVPFRINAVCELSLITAALAGQEKVDEAVVEAAAALAARAQPATAPGSAAGAMLAGAAVAASVAATVAAGDDEPDFGAEELQVASAVNAPVPEAETDDDDSTLDDLLGELEKDEEESEQPPAVEAAGEQVEVAAETFASEESDDQDLGGLLDELQQEEETSPEPASVSAADEDDGGLDDILGGLEAEEQDAAPTEEQSVEDMLGGLGDEQPVVDADDDPLGSMLDDLEAEEAPRPQDAIANQEDDELDDLLGGLGDEEEAVTAAPAADDVGGELDDLLGELGGDDAAADIGGGADDDLDDLLGDLGGADEPAPAAKKAESVDDELDDLLGDLAGDDDAGQVAATDGDAELDDLLSGLADEENEPAQQAAAEDDLDDLLNGLGDEPASAPAAGGDDELDDLLSGLTEDEPVPATPVSKTVAAAKPQPAAVGQADDGELDDLLNSLGDDLEAAPASKDNLEDELDSLLEGLDD
jgi:type II secretory pathway predicted ATPase ExeA